MPALRNPDESHWQPLEHTRTTIIIIAITIYCCYYYYCYYYDYYYCYVQTGNPRVPRRSSQTRPRPHGRKDCSRASSAESPSFIFNCLGYTVYYTRAYYTRV